MKAVIADIPKTSTEVVMVELSDYQGKDLFAIRVWTRDDPPCPTTKGLTASVKMLPAIITALVEAEALARQEGLFDA